MKKIIFLAAVFSLNVFAAGDNCYQISNQDNKNYCLATAKNDANYCYQISENDKKSICLAIAKKDKNYCYQVRNNDTKNQCLGQF